MQRQIPIWFLLPSYRYAGDADFNGITDYADFRPEVTEATE